MTDGLGGHIEVKDPQFISPDLDQLHELGLLRRYEMGGGLIEYKITRPGAKIGNAPEPTE